MTIDLLWHNADVYTGSNDYGWVGVFEGLIGKVQRIRGFINRDIEFKTRT